MEAILTPSSLATVERRADCRYPIHTAVQYRLFLGRRVVRMGSGWVVNMSRGGVLFESTSPVPPGHRMELEIDWPAQAVGMMLRVTGESVRSEGGRTAVRILRSSFRVRDEFDIAARLRAEI